MAYIPFRKKIRHIVLDSLTEYEFEFPEAGYTCKGHIETIVFDSVSWDDSIVVNIRIKLHRPETKSV